MTPDAAESAAVAAGFLNMLYQELLTGEFIVLWQGQSKRSIWCPSIEYALDAIPSLSGDIYFGVGLRPDSATIGEPAKDQAYKKGEATDIIGIPALWADIDIAADKAHQRKNYPPTLEDAMALVNGHGYDPSITVHSGYGLHCYWLFKELWRFDNDDERDQAAELNRRLQAAIRSRAQENGWTLDATANLDRILRVPGTTNHKNGDRKQVQILEVFGPKYNPTDLEELLPEAPASDPPRGIPVDLPEIPARGSQALKEKIDALCDIDPKFKATFDHARPDLKDQSASSYDMSLTAQAALMECTEEEQAGIILEFRSKHGLEPEKACRQDYIARTIAKAKTARASLDQGKPSTSPPQEASTTDTPWQKARGINPRLIKQALFSNQDGDAWLFRTIHRGHFVYDHSSGQWFKWRGHYWQEDIRGERYDALNDVIDCYQSIMPASDQETDRRKAIKARITALQTKRRKEEVFALAAQGTHGMGIRGDEWDRNPYLLACPNGVVALRTGELTAGRPEQYIRTVCPTDYDPAAPPPKRWQCFLHEITGGDSKLVAYLRRILGHALIGKVIEHRFFVLCGPGQNGKSTLLEVLAAILGEVAAPTTNELLLEQRYGSNANAPTPAIMNLQGRRLVWASETNDGRRFNAGAVKWFTGGDTLTGRHPHGARNVSFPPTHTLLLLTNHKPRADAGDDAFWYRCRLVEFPFSFVENPTAPHERQADPRLKDALLAEGPGILKELVEGCIEYQQHGFNDPAAVTAASAAYRDGENNVQRFIDECCALDSMASTPARDLYKAYVAYCETGGERAESSTAFGRLVGRQFGKRKSNGTRIYTGVRFGGTDGPQRFRVIDGQTERGEHV